MKRTMEGGVAVAELLMEEEEEEDQRRRGYSLAGGLAPQWAPAPEEAMPTGPGFWHPVQGIQVARLGLPATAKAQGKAPTVEPPPPEMDKELVQWLQQEVVVEEVRLGQDTITLEVVREAAGPLMQGQLEGLGGPPRWMGQASCPQLQQSSHRL